MVKKVLTPVIGGVRKMIQVPGANIAAGTTIAEFGTQTVSLAQLAEALARLTPPDTGLVGDGTEATLSVGPGLAGGGPLLGNVSLRLTAPLGAHMQFSDGADGEPGLTIPGLQGPQGPPGAAIPIRGEDGDDGLTIPGAAGTAGAAGAVGPQGMQGEDGEAGVSIPGAPGLAGAAGSPGAAGASGPPGMQGEDAEDPMVIPGAQGLSGLAGANGTAGPAIVIQAEDGEPGMMIPGAQGPQGVQGIPGASGTGAGGGASWAAYLDFDFEDPSWLSRPPVDVGGPHVWSGTAVFTGVSAQLGVGGFQVGAVTIGGNGNQPEIQMYGSGSATADQHLYSEYVDTTGTLHFRTVSDARTAATDWLAVARSGYAPLSASFSCPVYMTGNGTTSAASLTSGGAAASAILINAPGAGWSPFAGYQINSTPAGYFGFAGAANAIIVGASANAMVARTEGGDIVFSTNAGSNIGVRIVGGNGPLVSTGSGAISTTTTGVILDGGNSALFAQVNSGGGTDAKAWDSYSDASGGLHFRCVNDAYTAATDWLTVVRSGATPTGINFSALISAPGAVFSAAPATVGAGQIAYGGTTSASATTGSIVMPSLVAGFINVNVAGVAKKIAYFNS